MPLRTSRLALLALLPLLACEDSSYAVSLRCDVFLSGATPAEARPGESVVLTGTPLTQVWDTAVYVGPTRAELTALDREGCDACDECKEDSDCTDCSDCDACDALCEEECVETATFVVPELEPGATGIRLINVHGQSEALPFTVLAATDTGGAETGTTETGTTETGGGETGGGETGTSETGAESGGGETAGETALVETGADSASGG